MRLSRIISNCRIGAGFAHALVAVMVAVSGCSSDTLPVHGTVQREGSAVSEGRIVFTPIGGGKSAFGEIQPDGSFKLTTDRTNDGAWPGTYRVLVIQSRSSENGKLYTSYTAPRDKPLEVAAGDANEFAINIREQDGWQIHQDK